MGDIEGGLSIQDQLVLARSKLWTPELDKLLRRWKKQVEIRRRAHYGIAGKFSKRHLFLGIPATIIATIVSTGVIATFRNCTVACDGTKSDTTACDWDERIRIGIGIVGWCSTALTGVMTFMNYQAAANDHKAAADNYEVLHGTIESLLIVPPSVRGDPVSTLQSIRTQYDDTVRKSPNLPDKYQVDLSSTTVDQSQRPPTIPQLNPSDLGLKSSSSGVSRSSVNLLRAMAAEKDPSSEASSSQEMQTHHSTTDSDVFDAKLAEENDFDTDDDSHEVCLGFDLDHMAALNNTPTALAVANVAAQRDRQVQDSLLRALEFERKRLGSSMEIMQSSSSRRISKKHKKSGSDSHNGKKHNGHRHVTNNNESPGMSSNDSDLS